MTTRLDHFIAGEHSAPSDGGYLTSTNPATLETLYEFARGTEADVTRAVDAAAAAFASRGWQRTTPTQRGHLLRRFGDLIGENADELARLESQDNGKLLREMVGQLAGLPEYLYYYGGLADKVQGSQIPTNSPEVINFTQREALGVVGLITPWNSPMTLTLSKLAPALAAGNTAVIKPSEYTSRTILRLAELAYEAGFPAGVVNVVTGLGAEAGQALVDSPKLAKISFTGSTRTGSAIAASAAGRFIGSTLELGGKSPNIVFDDADVSNAAMGVIAGIFAAAGQTCIAGSRVFAQRGIYDELLEKVTARAASIVIGDPMAEETELGPLAFQAQLDKVSEYVGIGVAEGGRIAYGGGRPEVDLPGYFFQPTVLTDTTNDMRITQEEIFGPVAAVMPFDTEEEVLELANDTEYGLAAGVWTTNLARSMRMSQRLEAGTIWINMYRAMSPMSPRQGFKNSGVGIEHGIESMHEYTRLKSIWINTDEGPVADPFVLGR
ncbi:aldehyde dehydrogenase [Brevibacterium casei]|uniref:aldehyde dehydrogenase n=1 Tax=Brevibacterium TaxID=1696 RepID=UPI000926BDB5|nr:aldehyde dehydrogenase [Brevibacterium casei]SIG55846.1 aldehyde dehydrogenase [Mycobacteroides abscessus subsp. abscessus]MCT1446821.1 aldehyde dehydrogenase [Brevibacterium casei]MCT2182470.1 aldehyde dehydrogenase [Brevibacterium casei]MDH5147942.1 aldehyde dehydrogenase [Brevibacterium casei]QQT69838.1 aldehyde dehydrogenase [Brevibacterium casei]